MNRSLTGGLIVAAFGLSAAAARQQPIFRGGSDAVRVFVTVTDRDGRLVTTLARENFDVRDEGKPQPLTQFDNSPQPIRLMVLLDVSGSMAGNLPLLRAAATQLFSRLLPADVARVGAFGLARVAEESGGGYTEIRYGQDLGAAFAGVADELHTQYLLAFAPPERDGKVHEIGVRVDKGGLKPRARKSYVAPQDGRGRQ